MLVPILLPRVRVSFVVASLLAGAALGLLSVVAAPADESAPAGAPVVTLTPDGFLNDWLLLGPFDLLSFEVPLSDGVSRAGLHRDFLESIGGEGNAVLTLQTVVTYPRLDGAERVARPRRVSPAVDAATFNPRFRHLINDNHHVTCFDFNLGVGYAFCFVRSERAQTAQAYLSCYSRPKVFLNGDVVHVVNHAEMTRHVPWAHAIQLPLRAGLNRLLLKIANPGLYWGFDLQVFPEHEIVQRTRAAIEAVTVAAVAPDATGISVRAGLNPSPAAGFRLPVTVRATDESGRVVGEAAGQSGDWVRLNMSEKTATGPLTLRAALAGNGEPTPAKAGSRNCFWGDWPAARAALRDRLTRPLPNHWAPAWQRLFPAALDWIRFALAAEAVPAPDDPAALRALVYGRALADALEQGRNPLADRTPQATIPARFQGRAADGRKVQCVYNLRLPAGYGEPGRRWPMVLHLGKNATDSVGPNGVAAPWFDALTPPLIRLHVVSSDSFVHGDTWDLACLNALLDDLLVRLDVDPDRVCLQAPSGGGVAGWDWILANPERFAGACMMVPFDGYPYRSSRLRDLPIWVINGELDLASETFLPELMVNALRRDGADVVYTKLEGYSHTVSPGVDAKAWLAWYLGRRRLPAESRHSHPADPIVALDLAPDGIGPWRMIELPAQRYLEMVGDERLDYPQRDILRAAAKLCQTWQAATGRTADGRVTLRTSQGMLDGPVQLLLEPPPGEGDPTTPAPRLMGPDGAWTVVPAATVARIAVRAGGGWPGLVQKRLEIRARLEAQGWRGTGEERWVPLELAHPHTPPGSRLWEGSITVIRSR